MNELTTVLSTSDLVPHHPFAIDPNRLSESDTVKIGTAWITR